MSNPLLNIELEPVVDTCVHLLRPGYGQGQPSKAPVNKITCEIGVHKLSKTETSLGIFGLARYTPKCPP